MSDKNIGSSFDDFLAEDATLDEATSIAVERVIAWQDEMYEKTEPGDKGIAM